MKPVEFDSHAEAEVLDILAWYEKERPKAKDQFLTKLTEVIDFIEENPASGSPFRDGFRRIVLKRSPYYIIYKEYDTFSKIYAIMHGRRKPGYWAERLRQ